MSDDEDEEFDVKWLQCDQCGRWREFKEAPAAEEDLAGYWECTQGERSCQEPCDHCKRQLDCACRDAEPQEEGWVTVGQRVPPLFEAETKYRRGSCMPWLCYRAYCPACRRRSGNLDRRSKMDVWLATHRRCVPAWEGLTTEAFSWRLDGLAREVAKSAKQHLHTGRKLSSMDLEDRWSSDSEADTTPANKRRAIGPTNSSGGGKWWRGGGGGGTSGASDGSPLDGAAFADASITTPSGGSEGGEGKPPQEWQWTAEVLASAVEARICWLLQHRFSQADRAALARRPWHEVLDELQTMVTTLPPDRWTSRLREMLPS